jgi:hypothetical protein
MTTIDNGIVPTVRSRTVRRVAGSGAAALVLFALSGVGACTMGEGQGAKGAAELQPADFKFGPPDGMRGVRTERRRYEVAIVGTPLRNLEEEELTWNIGSKIQGDQYLVDQELAHVTLKHDGATVLDKDVEPGKVMAQLVIDKAGNLVDVKGLEETSKTRESLVGPNRKTAAERVFSTENLTALVANRYDETVGDVIGRPAKVGATWTTEGRPGSAVQSRTVSVQSIEPCGGATCARLQATYKMAPAAMISLANEVTRDYARWAGQAPSKIKAETAIYSMSGTLLTEPATMMNHEAALDESGKVFFAGPKQQMVEIDLTGKTEMSFDYTKPTASEAPLPETAAR